MTLVGLPLAFSRLRGFPLDTSGLPTWALFTLGAPSASPTIASNSTSGSPNASSSANSTSGSPNASSSAFPEASISPPFALTLDSLEGEWVSCLGGHISLRVVRPPPPALLAKELGPFDFPSGDKVEDHRRTRAVPVRGGIFRYELNASLEQNGVTHEVQIRRPDSSGEVERLAAEHGRLTFFVLTASLGVLKHNLLRSAAYADPLLAGGHQWVVVDANASEFGGNEQAHYCMRQHRRWVLRDNSSDVIIFVHDDIHLLPSFELDIYRQLDELKRQDPGWCMVGFAAGRVGGPVVGTWLGFGMRLNSFLPSQPVEVAKYMPDEGFLMLRRGSAAESDPSVEGFHCYGTDMALSCLARGGKVHLAPLVLGHKTWLADGTLQTFVPYYRKWSNGVDRAGLKAAGKMVQAKWKARGLDLAGLRTTSCPLS